MPTLWTQRDSNIRKTWLLISIFLLVVMSVGWVFAQIYGNPGILVIAVMLSFIMSIGSYWWSDKIVVATTGARLLRDEEAPDVHNIVENLAITAGLPKPKIYIVDTPQPNAFATGRNPEHALVAVTSGLLRHLNRTELEGVLAHELSHVGNRDMLIATVAVVLVGFIQLISDMFIRSMMWGGMGRDRESRAHPALIMVGIALALLAPFAAILMQLAISRKREFLADASGSLSGRISKCVREAATRPHAYAPSESRNCASLA